MKQTFIYGHLFCPNFLLILSKKLMSAFSYREMMLFYMHIKALLLSQSH